MNESKASCCTPTRGPVSEAAQLQGSTPLGVEEDRADRIFVPGGRALIGTSEEVIPFDGEGPLRSAKLDPFLIDATSVTNDRFAKFVEDTGFQTEAERIGWSFVFQGHIADEVEANDRVPNAPWWRRMDGAHWRCINGPDVNSKLQGDHPVVHISWNDAKAFAQWAGGDLPSEAEWEHAARGGLGDVVFPWGNDQPNDEDFFPCNIWQGQFPERDLGADGYTATAPAQSFEPNGYGLYNMCGNVWEWTRETYKIRSLKKAARERQSASEGYKTLKGGSFLCHRTYCFRYRIAARSGNSPDSATTHMGFRLVYPAA